MCAAATSIDPIGRWVTLDDGHRLTYDYLVIATRYRNQGDVAPGFTEHPSTITTLPAAERTGAAWRRFLVRGGRRCRRRPSRGQALRRGIRVPVQYGPLVREGRIAQAGEGSW